MVLRFCWTDVARPFLAKLRESLDTTRRSEDEVEQFFVDDLAELLVATTAGHLIGVQSIWEKSLRKMLIRREASLYAGAMRFEIERARWGEDAKGGLNFRWFKLMGTAGLTCRNFMTIFIPATSLSAASSKVTNSHLAALADLVTQMTIVRRDTKMPEELKKAQLALLSEQTEAIRQTAVNRAESLKKSVLVDSSSESADAAALAAQGAQGDQAVGTTVDAARAVSEQSSSTASASSGAHSEASLDSPSLGAIVNTYA